MLFDMMGGERGTGKKDENSKDSNDLTIIPVLLQLLSHPHSSIGNIEIQSQPKECLILFH